MKKIQINKIRCIFAASLAVVAAVFLNGCGILLEDRTFALSLSVDYKEGEYLVWYGISDLYDEVSEKEESGEVNEKSETELKGISMEEARNKFLSGNTLSPAWTRWIRYTRLCNGGTAGTFSTRCAASGVRRKKERTV